MQSELVTTYDTLKFSVLYKFKKNEPRSYPFKSPPLSSSIGQRIIFVGAKENGVPMLCSAWHLSMFWVRVEVAEQWLVSVYLFAFCVHPGSGSRHLSNLIVVHLSTAVQMIIVVLQMGLLLELMGWKLMLQGSAATKIAHKILKDMLIFKLIQPRLSCFHLAAVNWANHTKLAWLFPNIHNAMLQTRQSIGSSSSSWRDQCTQEIQNPHPHSTKERTQGIVLEALSFSIQTQFSSGYQRPA